MNIDHAYGRVSQSPYWNPFADRAWEATFRLASNDWNNIISEEKARRLRRLIPIIWDSAAQQYVDLFEPQSRLIAHINTEYEKLVADALATIASEGIIRELSHGEISSLYRRARLQGLLRHIPQPVVDKTKILIYGHDGTKTEPSSSGWYLTKNGQIILACQPNLYTLATHIVMTQSMIETVGGPIVNLGEQIIGGIVEIIADEHIPMYSFVAEIFNLMINAAGEKPVSIALSFIQGDPQPLFAALDKHHPVLADMLIFATGSDTTEDDLLHISYPHIAAVLEGNG